MAKSQAQDYGPIVTKKDLRKANYRWLMSVCTFNYQTQQGASVAYALSPILRKIYKKDDDYVEALNNHFQYYNTQPWLAAIILGACVAMEERQGLGAKDAVNDFKVGTMGPLAGIGDSLLMTMIPTIMGSIAAYMALENNPFGIILWGLLIGVIFFLRMHCFEFGYRQGAKVVTEYGDKINYLTEAASVLGITVVGSLIGSVISVTSPLKFQFGKVAMKIQPMLDKILPQLIPVLLVFLAYKLIKSKKLSMTWVILLFIVIAMFGAAFGFLG
ncbi:PTS system mannose/fructose/sorbose family transporter subunit IID [Lacticaseibacillus paracasei]|uniref:PTS system mannose/fructose/sorbose family transporter subunit IID n=1 Tax=Lacticaseibacillus paracasei TaxID=1597 RepID=UPI002ADED551|nr:PTS system mannose/fructose/sorbose family transporter subunit IID [Lacticaseibacillus paracasei]MEA0974156.1 PTS system mannose/fructose/sorbose family transporter subunit IID [Lacticaseibacillus paracasei]